MRSILALLFVCTGCSSLDYKGTSYSTTTFHDNPSLKDYYLGMNANFAVDRPSYYRAHPTAEPFSTPASATQGPNVTSADGK